MSDLLEENYKEQAQHIAQKFDIQLSAEGESFDETYFEATFATVEQPSENQTEIVRKALIDQFRAAGIEFSFSSSELVNSVGVLFHLSKTSDQARTQAVIENSSPTPGVGSTSYLHGDNLVEFDLAIEPHEEKKIEELVESLDSWLRTCRIEVAKRTRYTKVYRSILVTPIRPSEYLPSNTDFKKIAERVLASVKGGARPSVVVYH